ncbi:MAG TPA: FecR domain-containing protein [Rhizomicrobium sp.]
MSDIAEENPWDALNAKPVDMRAAGWCERRGQSGWNEKDEAELNAWLAETPAHMVAYLRMSHVWNRADRLAALKQPVPDVVSSSTETRKPNFPRRGTIMVAAIGLIGAVAFALLRTSAEENYATRVGGHKIVALADGSQVELNTDTQLRVVSDARQRTVLLDRGEAFFQIKHDAARPFVVIANGQRVTDLGTKFLVRREVGDLRVSVVEGRVRLEAGAAHAKPAILLPGDVAIATANSVSVAKQAAPQLSSELGWRHGVLIFRHMSLAGAADEFNRYNREKLVVADTATAHLTIDGTFPANNPGAFTRLAEEIFGLRVMRGDNEIVISR